MNEKTIKTALITSVLSMILSAVCLIILLSPKEAEKAPGVQYVMYVGTGKNPGDPNEDVKEIVDNVCLKYFGGYTLQEATGAWTDDDGGRSHEYTLVCYIDGAEKEDVYKAADELIGLLHQQCILIETDTISTDFYYGTQSGQ